jgi:DNA-3-methyladenine glycosylase
VTGRGPPILQTWTPTSAPSPLTRAFYERPTTEVARDLLGKLLVRSGTPTRVARIVEVEAYLGQADAASHARHGPTPRARIMFGPPGFLYVYLVYGMHNCMNFVTESDGTAGAVLIRAAQPLAGFDHGANRRQLAGPGRLCAGFGVTRLQNGLDLCAGEMFLATDDLPRPRIKRSARIGVLYAGAWANRKLRFYVPGDPHISVRPRE